jgi:hypothetical protein
MTPEEIIDIMQKSEGNMTDWQCRCLVHYMMGYLRHATNIDWTRDEFFRQVKASTEGKAIPVWP